MKFITNIFLLFILILIVSCNSQAPKQKEKKTNVKSKVKIPEFNADSAFLYVEQQVAFGPRVPNTVEHIAAADYLKMKLYSFSDTAFFQNFKTRAFDGTVLNGKNIIGVFNPDEKTRILLCAHWDSRPFADYDPDPNNHRTPIDGANDGASGVGVLLEIARQLHIKSPKIGIDIIFFDAEDYGPPQDEQRRTGGNWWALGSQYWAANPHIFDYNARYGILLDMVGAYDATFLMEGYSMEYAPGVLKKVWNTGHRLGYNESFVFKQLGYIDDDHKPINEIIGIPSIDIIHLDEKSSTSSFFEHWHTTNDNMDAISKETLKIVGQTLLTVIFEEK